MSVFALVPAAGRGLRLGENTPKAFVEIGGRSLLALSLDGLAQSGDIDRVIVIVPEELVDSTADSLPDHVTVVAGGSERTDSVRAGLAHAGPADIVLVHDAARAFTPAALVSRVVAEVRSGRSAVIPVLPVTDTIKQIDTTGIVVNTLDRATLRAVQTPQGFEADLLRRAYDAAPDHATDDAGLVERLGVAVHTISGDPLAFKITTPNDLLLARALTEARRARP